MALLNLSNFSTHCSLRLERLSKAGRSPIKSYFHSPTPNCKISYYLRLPERRGVGEPGIDFLSPAAVREEGCLGDFEEADLGAERRVR